MSQRVKSSEVDWYDVHWNAQPLLVKTRGTLTGLLRRSERRVNIEGVTYVSVMPILVSSTLSFFCSNVSFANSGSSLTLILYFCRIIVIATMLSNSEKLGAQCRMS